jgi:uncharacterized protein YjlB
VCSSDLEVIIIIRGGGRIISEDSQAVDFTKGQTILLPAVFKGEILFKSLTEYLLTTL